MANPTNEKFADDNIEKSDEEEEAEDVIDDEDDDEDDGVMKWEVKEVTRMAHQNGRIEFQVTWESDGSVTWEPITSFPGEYEHRMIQEFKNKNLRHFERMMQSEKKVNKQQNAKWSYVVDSADRYEKPDESAGREAKSLSDPNRLEDPDEKFLKTYGIEGRMSRSKSRNIRRTIDMSSADSSPSVPSTPQEKKEPIKKGRKRKGKEELTTAKSRPTSSNLSNDHSEPPAQIAHEEKVEGDRKNNIVEKEKAENTLCSKKTVMENQKSSLPPIKKKRVTKLNSSDSSDTSDEEEEKQPAKRKTMKQCVEKPSIPSVDLSRIEGGTNFEASSSSMRVNPGLNRSLHKNGTSSIDQSPEADNQSKEQKSSKTDNLVKAREPEGQRSDIRNSKVDYATDEEVEKAFADFGFKVTGPIEKPENQQLESYTSNGTIDELNDVILALDTSKLQVLLTQKGPVQSFHEICRKHSLHEMMARTYEALCNACHFGALESRQRKMEQVLRITYAHIPAEILRVQDNELNTLLHWGINARNMPIVRFLLNMGSPLHIRNRHGMTAVEACLVTKQARFLELILLYGGTFHHVICRNPIIGTDHYPVHAFLANLHEGERNALLNTSNIVYGGIDEACRHVRHNLLASRLQEFELGPIVCVPRGNMKNDGYQQTIQFMIPEKWVDLRNEKYMLVIMPMAYHHIKQKFFGYPRAPVMRTPPTLCGVECETMSNTEQTIFYRATKSLQTHFQKIRELEKFKKLEPPPKFDISCQMSREERDQTLFRSITTPFHPRICTISLDIDPNQVFSFLTCQVIRFKPISRTPRTLSNGSNNRPTFGSTYNNSGSTHRSHPVNNNEPSSSRYSGPSTSTQKFSHKTDIPR